MSRYLGGADDSVLAKHKGKSIGKGANKLDLLTDPDAIRELHDAGELDIPIYKPRATHA